MDILKFFDILLKPPQPSTGLFLMGWIHIRLILKLSCNKSNATAKRLLLCCISKLGMFPQKHKRAHDSLIVY